MLSKKYKLKKEFHATLQKGKRVKAEKFIIVYIHTNRMLPSVGLLVTKKIGNAVVRNKVKRQISNIIRQNLNKMRTDINIVIIPSKFTDWKNTSYSSLEKELVHYISNL